MKKLKTLNIKLSTKNRTKQLKLKNIPSQTVISRIIPHQARFFSLLSFLKMNIDNCIKIKLFRQMPFCVTKFKDVTLQSVCLNQQIYEKDITMLYSSLRCMLSHKHEQAHTQVSLHVQFITCAKSQYFNFLFFYYTLPERNFLLKNFSLKII